VLVGTAAVGLIGSGVFITDPVSGFPPGSHDDQVGSGRTGQLHNVCAIPIFLGIPAAALLSARSFASKGDWSWACYSAGSGVLMATSFALFSAAFGQAPGLVAWGGLLQRISITAGFGWLTALSMRTRRTLSRGLGERPG
jgi:Protein of unknown function (DUF998)